MSGISYDDRRTSVAFRADLREKHVFEVAAVNAFDKQHRTAVGRLLELPLSKRRHTRVRFRSPPDFVLMSEDHGPAHITLTAAIILVNNASTIAALTSTALLSPQACMTVISLSVYSLPSVISSPRNRLKGKISCAISGTPSPSSESTRFAGISPSTAAPRILTNF